MILLPLIALAVASTVLFERRLRRLARKQDTLLTVNDGRHVKLVEAEEPTAIECSECWSGAHTTAPHGWRFCPCENDDCACGGRAA